MGDSWEKYEKLVMAGLERAEKRDEALDNQVSSLALDVNKIKTQNVSNNDKLDKLYDAIIVGPDSVSSQLHDLAERVDAIEEKDKQATKNKNEQHTWLKTSVVAVVAGSIGALWEIIKHFWLK